MDYVGHAINCRVNAHYGNVMNGQRVVKPNKTEKNEFFNETKIFYLMVGAGAGLFVIDVLLFFFSIGGLLVLSLLDDERFVGSACSMSCTLRLMYCASGQCLATLCSNAVVDDVLNKPSARRRNPWLKHASTAAHNDVTEQDSSWTNFLVTASSMICFTSFFTVAINRSLKSSASMAKRQEEKRGRKQI